MMRLSRISVLCALWCALDLSSLYAQEQGQKSPQSKPEPVKATKATAGQLCSYASELAKAGNNSEKKNRVLQKQLDCLEKERARQAQEDITKKNNEELQKKNDELRKKIADMKSSLSSREILSSAAKSQPETEKPHPTGETAPALAVGAEAQQSVYSTSNACAIGTDTKGRANGQSMLLVHRELMRQEEVQDDFGNRLGKRFLVYQVSVTNASKDFQYEVSDIEVDLRPVFDAEGVPLGRNHATHQASSQTLSMLRGVPEKGQDLDPRNLTLHVLQGVGAVGAGISGLTPFSGTMGSAMANFNGAFIQAITGIAPDHTATQLNRLSDLAFSSNTLLEKLQTKTYAVFIPKSFVLTNENAKQFHRDPRTLLNKLPLDQVNVCVDGILLQQVSTTADPSLTPRENNVIPDSTITLSDATPGAVIYFTVNGDTPSSSSTRYSIPIPAPALDQQLTVKAFAIAPNLAPSNTVVKTFIAKPQASTPTIAPSATTGKLVITPGQNGQNDQIFYTTDGSAPDSGSTLYTGEFSAKTGQTIKAVEIGNSTSLSKPTDPYKVP